ncbi:LacI family DNA-binding transcriptional regulator [Christensenellaceae bacterium OttesenSCG-928-M15]|nr:LacI family DNA-binding transcriptional regulator [Christensenellaceae bacterium OttesenSCG-928-M15]
MANIKAKDIAERLGISAAAVSMALNGKSGVSEETRERVLAEAANSGYVTPRATRAVPAATKTISFVIYVGVGVAEQTSFSTFILQGVEAGAKHLGYRVVVHYLYENQSLQEQLAAITSDTCGLILLGTDITEAQRDIISSQLYETINIPMVVVDNFLFASYVDCVGNDNMFGSKAAVSYLIRHGHRRIGYLRSKQRITNFEDREIGIQLALAEGKGYGLAPLETIDVDISSEKAYHDVCGWLQRGNKPAGAYFAENDMLAAAAMRAFTANGYRVPQDVSIIGFDDVPICEMTQPTITTMHSFKERLGEISATQLHQRILAGDTARSTGETGAMKIAMSLSVKERESVKTV